MLAVLLFMMLFYVIHNEVCVCVCVEGRGDAAVQANFVVDHMTSITGTKYAFMQHNVYFLYK